MDQILSTVGSFLTGPQMVTGAKALAILVLGYLLARVVPRLVPVGKLQAQHSMMVRRLARYAVLMIAFTMILNLFGLDLSVLVGAAGILTVAVGFASQTSASNLISGLFLMGEQPFVIGDYVRVGDTTGEVVSIDLLSVKLRTFDNLLVRIPNETMLKANVTNLTHFPIRRLDMQIGVAYKEEIQHVREVLLVVAAANPICLEEPEPLIIFLGYGDSSLDLQFSVWCAKENILTLRNTMYEQVKVAFDEQGIEIPFPHRSLYTGSATEPFPVRMVEGEEKKRSEPHS